MQSRTYWHNLALEQEGQIPPFEMQPASCIMQGATSKPLVLTLPGQVPAVVPTAEEWLRRANLHAAKKPKVAKMPAAAQPAQNTRQTAAIPSIETFRKSEATESATQAVLSAISAQTSESGDQTVTPAELIARLQEHYGYNTSLMIADLCKKARESVLQGSVPLDVPSQAAVTPSTSAQGANVVRGNPYAAPGGMQMAQSPGEMSDDSGVSLMSPSAAYSAPASANSLPPVSPYMPAGAPPASPYTPHSALPTQSASAEAMYPATPATVNQMPPSQATVPIQGPDTSGNVVEVVPGKVHSINMTRQIIIDGQPISYLLEGVLVTPSDEEQENEHDENNGVKTEEQKSRTAKSSRRNSSDSNETTLAEEMSIDGQPLAHLLKDVLSELADEQNVNHGQRIKGEASAKKTAEMKDSQSRLLEVTSGDSPFPIIQQPAPSVVDQIVIDGQPVLNLFDNMSQGASNTRGAEPMESMQNTAQQEQIPGGTQAGNYPMPEQNEGVSQNFGSMIQEVVDNTPATNYENASMYVPEQNVMMQGAGHPSPMQGAGDPSPMQCVGGVGPSPSDIQETAETLINLAQSLPIDNCPPGNLPGTSANLTAYNPDHNNQGFLNALFSAHDQQVSQSFQKA